MHLGDETGHDLVSDLSRAQQLVEMSETGAIMQTKYVSGYVYMRTSAFACNLHFFCGNSKNSITALDFHLQNPFF